MLIRVRRWADDHHRGRRREIDYRGSIMHDTTTATTELLDAIRIFLDAGDLEDARFLRDAIRESVASGEDWITSAESKLLATF